MYINYSLNQIGNNYIVYNKVDKNHYEIGYVDYKILQYFQKGLSKEDICKKLSIDKDEFEKNKMQLFEMGFLSDVPLKKKLKVKWNKIYLFRIDTRRFKRSLLTVFLERMLIVMSLFSLTYFFYLIVFNRINLEHLLVFDNTNLLEITLSLRVVQILTVVIHEFFHLIFTINRGANVPEIGVMLYFLSPSGFSDLTQINFFKKKSSKIICLLAGLLFNFTLLTFSILMLSFFDLPIFKFILISNLVAIVINLGFYIKLDGYYILQILLEENYLREKSLDSIKKLTTKQPKMEDIVYYIIGFCSIAYVPILLINILISFWRSFG